MHGLRVISKASMFFVFAAIFPSATRCDMKAVRQRPGVSFSGKRCHPGHHTPDIVFLEQCDSNAKSAAIRWKWDVLNVGKEPSIVVDGDEDMCRRPHFFEQEW